MNKRRYYKKVTVNGVVTLHQHYLYRGYLQIAALDLTRSNAPTLWLLHWDPIQPVATRPLSLRKNGTWYTYGHDLTKNVTELYKADGTIATAYDYTPYGTVTASGIDQPIQWSSEHYDPELALVYYNYRHYNPADGRWINRDPIGEREHLHLSIYVRNNPSMLYDLHGLETTDDEMAKALEEIRVKISGEDDIEIDCKGVESAKQAARNVIEKWNPVSIKDDVEYGGRVCACCVRKTKKYLYITTHVRGKNGEVEPEDAPPCPVGYKLAGIWHTHGKASSKDPYETFAPADIMKIHKLGVPGYLGTPSGAVRTLDPNKTTPPPAYNTPDPTKKTIV